MWAWIHTNNTHFEIWLAAIPLSKAVKALERLSSQLDSFWIFLSDIGGVSDTSLEASRRKRSSSVRKLFNGIPIFLATLGKIAEVHYRLV